MNNKNAIDGVDFFCEFLDFVMPWEDGVAVMLAAYLDASKRENGIFSVAAIAYGTDRAKKATKEWHGLWGKDICHMKHLHSRKKNTPFEHWSGDKAGEFLKKSINIINDKASCLVVVSCDINSVRQFMPKVKNNNDPVVGGFNNEYGVCCHFAMGLLGKIVSANTDIAYFFEKGDAFQKESQKFISKMIDDETTLYKYRSHAVLEKKDCRLFESADILAWEWANHIQRLREKKPMRPSIKSLIGNYDRYSKDLTCFYSNTRRAYHLDEKTLENYYKDAIGHNLFDII